MSAYDRAYLFDAMQILGEAFDFAAREKTLGSQQFFDLFVQSGIAEAFGEGTPRYVAGVSGIELVLLVCERAGMPLAFDRNAVHASLDRTSDYWCGWIMAYVQWRSGRTFVSIREALDMRELKRRYTPLHEASEDRAADQIEALIMRKGLAPKIKTIRQARGMTQVELADASDTSLRAIQQYEQRVKDINKAAAFKLYKLSGVLGCKMEDLLEF